MPLFDCYHVWEIGSTGHEFTLLKTVEWGRGNPTWRGRTDTVPNMFDNRTKANSALRHTSRSGMVLKCRGRGSGNRFPKAEGCPVCRMLESVGFDSDHPSKCFPAYVAAVRREEKLSIERKRAEVQQWDRKRASGAGQAGVL